MTALLDVNLLVALAWPNHIHHEKSHGWFKRHQREGWATCSMTQTGFVRVSSNRRIIPEARTPMEAIQLLQRIMELGHHAFWEDDVSFVRSTLPPPHMIQGHQQVTDAHLIALALRHGGRLATLDRGATSLLPASMPAAQAIILIA